MTPGRRAAASPWRGRSRVAAALVGFVLVAALVIWRRGYGVEQGAEMRTLDRKRMQLAAEKATLERQIQELAGRARLGTVAEQRLDMHVPADSQVIVLPAPVLPGPVAGAGPGPGSGAGSGAGADRHAAP